MTDRECLNEIVKITDALKLQEDLEVAIDAMRKYQRIQEIYNMWNDVNNFSYKNAMQNIGEVLEK